ncbi:MAG: GNAT family N-acetyltransferase [Candidatus Lokiarchaeota archaeon]|nr:GNAT family N-acetyltransferase [Candidatus Lokiarchaeota archaeon]
MTDNGEKLKKTRIRSFFLNLKEESKTSSSREQKDKSKKDGLTYKKMKLPINKITPELKTRIKDQIDPHILTTEVREAQEKDLRSLLDIYNRAWMTSNTPFNPMEFDSLKKLYKDPDIIILIAKLYGKDVGFIILDFEGENKEYGVIAGIGVIPRQQRKGIGKVLAMEAWKILNQKDIDELRCEVYKKNDVAYNYIKSIGFEEYDTVTYKKEDFESISSETCV